jgi:Spy/CpxP family protein refolding chaperone
MNPMFRSTLFLALLALPLSAQPGPDSWRQADHGRQALHLTEAQQASIRAIREKHRSDLTLKRDAVLHARIDLRTALKDPATPEARLRALYEKASGARFDLILAQRATRLEAQAVLSPEQRAMAAELGPRAHARMQGRKGQREGWGLGD